MKFDLLKLPHGLKASYYKMNIPDGVVIVLPGAGYSAMGPAIYYPTEQLFNREYNILNFEYEFKWIQHTGEAYAEFMNKIKEGLNTLDLPTKKVVLAKSIGTRFLASSMIEAHKYIWLTPALEDDFVYEKMLEHNENSLTIIGDKDQFYNEERLSKLSHKLILKGTDHGLDVGGNVYQSIDNLKLIVKSIDDFVGQP